MKRNGNSSSAFSAVNVIIVLIILAILGVGSYAVYQKVSDNMLDKAIADGTAEQNVKTMARQAGQSVDEYLDYYGLKDAGLNENSTMDEMTEKMTVGNFAKLQGQDFDAFTSTYGLSDKGLTEDSMWTDAEKLIPLGTYIGDATQVDAFKEYYGLGADVTADTPWGDVADTVKAKNEEMANATAAPADTATAAPADTATAAPADTATTAPAAQ